MIASISLEKIYNAGIRYIKFLNIQCGQYSLILISKLYQYSNLGCIFDINSRFFSLSSEYCLPSALIGKSIGQVFYQAASVEKRETGKIVTSLRVQSKSFNSRYTFFYYDVLHC